MDAIASSYVSGVTASVRTYPTRFRGAEGNSRNSTSTISPESHVNGPRLIVYPFAVVCEFTVLAVVIIMGRTGFFDVVMVSSQDS